MKETTIKRLHTVDSNNITFWKKSKTTETVKRISDFRGYREGRVRYVDPRESLGQ